MSKDLVSQNLKRLIKYGDQGFTIKNASENVEYEVQYDPFRIIQKVDGQVTLTVND